MTDFWVKIDTLKKRLVVFLFSCEEGKIIVVDIDDYTRVDETKKLHIRKITSETLKLEKSFFYPITMVESNKTQDTYFMVVKDSEDAVYILKMVYPTDENEKIEIKFFKKLDGLKCTNSSKVGIFMGKTTIIVYEEGQWITQLTDNLKDGFIQSINILGFLEKNYGEI